MNAPSDVIRVAVVDDDALTHHALCQILDVAADVAVVWSAETGQEALRKIDAEPDAVDVLLMDMNMPGMNGIETTLNVRRVRPDIRVVMLTTLDRTDYIRDAVNAGVSGFLVKDAHPSRLVAAIRAAHQGVRVFTAEAAERMVKTPLETLRRETAPSVLTDKELTVVQLVSQSLTNSQIARRLAVSEATVKSHVSSVIVKLDCTDRVGMVMWAFRHGHLS